MRAHSIASATISVVKDGELYFAKGYGYADRETRRPVDPERTLFRPGSISKLFFFAAAGLHWIYWHWNVLGFRYCAPGKT